MCGYLCNSNWLRNCHSHSQRPNGSRLNRNFTVIPVLDIVSVGTLDTLRPYSDESESERENIKEQMEKIGEKSAIIKGNICFRFRFRLV